MNRREFLTMTAAATASLALPRLASAKSKSMSQPIIPPRLKPGDKVALVAPASPIGKPEDLDSFLIRTRELGLEPVQGPNLEKEFGFFGGTDQERADDLNWAFQNPEIKAVLPIRGGYGCTRILHLLDYQAIKQNPKILCGYSDITALLIAIFQECNLITYHGPVLASSISDFADSYFKPTLFGPEPNKDFINPTPETLSPEDHTKVDPAYAIQSLGTNLKPAHGPIVGGNLSLIAAMCGTPYQIRGKGKIIFFEDISEKPYRIDRMLTQLIHAGCFKDAAGIICGQFTDCDPKEPEPNEWLVADVIKDRLTPLNLPTITGTAIGHIKHKWTIPVGATVEINPTTGKIHLP
ncbi:MAG: LD-carboxypeptidase [Fimbriimonadaceae bacterium]